MKTETTRSKRNGGEGGEEGRPYLLTQNLVPQNWSIVWFSILTHLIGRRKPLDSRKNLYLVLQKETNTPHCTTRNENLFSFWQENRFRVPSVTPAVHATAATRCKALTTTEGGCAKSSVILRHQRHTHRPPDCSSSLPRRHTSAFGNFVGREAQNCRTILQRARRPVVVRSRGVSERACLNDAKWKYPISSGRVMRDSWHRYEIYRGQRDQSRRARARVDHGAKTSIRVRLAAEFASRELRVCT